MTAKVVLVGHCGPDASYLRLAVSKALPGATVSAADDAERLDAAIASGADLLLMNRVLDYGFATDSGIELIRTLRVQHPGVKLMLVSNYEDAQREAIAAGALPGFGKKQLRGGDVAKVLKDALDGPPLK